MEELVVLGAEEKQVKEKIAEIEIEPKLNRYNEVVYKVILRAYTKDGYIPTEIRGGEVLGYLFTDTWGWAEGTYRTRYEIFKTREEAEEEARKIIETLKKNYEEYLKKKRQIERERKVIHIYL